MSKIQNLYWGNHNDERPNVLVIGYWIFEFICNLVLVICDLKSLVLVICELEKKWGPDKISGPHFE
jgi:hypothetical protein